MSEGQPMTEQDQAETEQAPQTSEQVAPVPDDGQPIDEPTDQPTDQPIDQPTDQPGEPAPDGGPSRTQHLETEGDIAADYLEELLDIADLDGDIELDVDGDRASVSIVGADLQQLVGRDGGVLEALQELTRLAVYRETGERSRLMLDISGYRAGRREELVELAEKTIAEVKQSGEPATLEPMSPFERKIVHDAVAAAGLASASEGVEPRRHVVVLPG